MAASSSSGRLVRLAEILNESRIPGSRGDTARKLTVRLYGRGVVAKADAGGSEETRYFRRRAGQLIYSKLDCLNGAIGLIPPHLDGYESTADLPAFDITKSVDPDFFLAFLSRPSFYLRFKAVAIGSRKANRVPADEFLATKVELPSRSEQSAIAAVLRASRERIDAAEALVSALTETKRNIMRELLTLGVARDPERLKPLCERWVMGRVADDVEAVPEGWRLVPLTRVARLESGHTPSRDRPGWWDGDIPWLSLADTDALGALTVEATAERVTAEGIRNSSARLLPAGTVVFSRTATVGKSTIMSVPMATSQDFANWVCGPEIEPRYLLQVFRHMTREWERLQEGSTHQTIYMPVFKKLQILLPPRPEQLRIADVGEAFDRRLEAERAHLSELRATRDALAAELLSGRLRLPAAVIARHAGVDPGARAA
jgi:type I restriction enzyme S subunit